MRPMADERGMAEPLQGGERQGSSQWVGKALAGLLALAGVVAVAAATVRASKLGPPTDSPSNVLNLSQLYKTKDVVNSTVAYFGCGCFWHVQNAMVESLEEKLFHRDGKGLTAFAGYAGGTSVGKGGRVCYHNFMDVADYGSMGHAEVVSLALPGGEDGVATAAGVYLDGICQGGVRRDFQDAGGEYRSLVGLPGGLGSRAGAAFAAEARKRGIEVKAGRGADPDVKGAVYVMDTAEFPFRQAELFHQFHDDMTESYSDQYHALKEPLVAGGRLKATGCPSD
mmetsp:Transcript_8685/g.23234  ORF Transcript_8685/g.23234 Transcript_8685/m.23234 type:complete len:282 (-) Transcript_8685:64-909(-)